ncbi:hypothetical protein ACH4A8_29030 [Streptomyces vietnamensis]|uniref:hypothetical protein n=1 Tax=Streptomyces vietnamensis TaxID=362257 RepID=UPI00378C528E
MTRIRKTRGTADAAMLITPSGSPSWNVRACTAAPDRPGVGTQCFGGHADAAEWIAAERYPLPEVARSLGQ